MLKEGLHDLHAALADPSFVVGEVLLVLYASSGCVGLVGVVLVLGRQDGRLDLVDFLLLLHLVLQHTILQEVQVVVEDHGVGNDVLREPHHAASRHRRERRVLQRLHLEHDAHVGRNLQALAVGESEELVVVEDRVEVLGPLGVHVAVKHDPVAPVLLASQGHQDATKYVGKDTIRPLQSGGVELAVELVLGDGLGVDDVGLALAAVDLGHGVDQQPPGSRLARPDVAHHHDAVAQVLNLVQLQDFLEELVSALEVPQSAQSLDLVGEDGLLHHHDIGTREDARHQTPQQRHVLRHQLWHECVAN
mmetsp:Transcript_24250/g.59856  ORF Transcript_24250/g.59856 Transcript_24250/m.59856 type:complete len:305 (+) Transcript_24250:6836-7750(+)